ncbi:MAG: metal-sulfur cluster assembly factor [Candidatus Omnitrophica bacterium]|nr:metal-sulfur cluster assembly factor [Candidatus Omnitrophota bacterium]
MAITEQQVLDAVRPIEDPELHLGIVDLGLIYEIQVNPSPEGDEVKLRMTFTSPFCPYGPALKAQVQQAITTVPGVKGGQVEIVFTPPWDPRTMASEECRIALGLGWDEEDAGGQGGELESQR